MAPDHTGMAESEARLDALEAACRKVGAKLTHQRREVFRALVETDGHPDAQAVFLTVRRSMPTISFDTVYRTLAFLEDHALVRRVRLSADRIRYEVNPRPHHHFICTCCGRLFDFESRALDALTLPEAATGQGSVSGWQLQVYGTCRDCERT
ncbi:MAG TPA: transcriptional repressor, partial [Candidatus Acetothermia bacterium]|nr:transcriptional repressor [Candidatus Acetothermia bacterium]